MRTRPLPVPATFSFALDDIPTTASARRILVYNKQNLCETCDGSGSLGSIGGGSGSLGSIGGGSGSLGSIGGGSKSLGLIWLDSRTVGLDASEPGRVGADVDRGLSEILLAILLKLGTDLLDPLMGRICGNAGRPVGFPVGCRAAGSDRLLCDLCWW
jgi:hypothetical protein